MNSDLSRLLRPHYLTLQGYVSAGMEVKKDDSTIFMNANENPFSLPGLEGFNRYPEPQPVKLLQAYADLYGVQPGNIVATRGADEAIVILTKLFCEPHKDAILTHPPTFGMYPVDARAMPADVVEVPLLKKNGTFALDVEGIIAGAKKENVKLIFICNPNNPTATAFPHAEIEKICRETRGHAIVLLDETYAEFSKAGSLAPKLKDHPNLIILRTLSKSYAMAGMRMGCMLSGDTDFIALVRSKGLDAYPLPHASINAALHVMSPEIRKVAHVNIKTLLAEKERLVEAFVKSPLTVHVYPSDANFFLVEMKDAKGFLNHCAKHKIILRDFSTKPLTENCLRISAGTPAENDLLLDLLKKFQ
ncbi:MAG: histidinol-phosphate transaminase [Alphaproteobacteria bacterium]|nr:histidinol-phosphate transaminase [Alphaproteobacteria bacterium]